MYHPAYWIVFSATTALLFIPGTQQRRVFSLSSDGARGKGRRGRGKEEKRECKRHVSEGRLAACMHPSTHTHWLAGSQADKCPQQAMYSLPGGAGFEIRTMLQGADGSVKGTTGTDQLWSQG